MGHQAPSLSKSALLLSPCLSWVRPEAAWYQEDLVDSSDLTARNNGSRCHELIAGFIDNTITARPGIPDNVEVMSRYQHAVNWLEHELKPRAKTIRAEVAYGVNWATGEAKELVGVKDRNYPKEPGWMYGTADVVAELHDGSLLVGDWKTGGTEGAREQLLSLAFAASRTHQERSLDQVDDGDQPTPSVSIVCLPLNEDGCWAHEEWVPHADLMDHMEAMREVRRRLVAPGFYGVQEVPGLHCTMLFCPHLGYCKTIGNVVNGMAEMASGEPLIPVEALFRMNVTDKPSSDEEAGFTQAMVSAANRRTKYLTNANKDRVSKHRGRVVFGNHVWEDRGNGYRWHKS